VKQTVVSSSLLGIFIGSILQEMCSPLRQQHIIHKSMIKMIFIHKFCGFHAINFHTLKYITCVIHQPQI